MFVMDLATKSPQILNSSSSFDLFLNSTISASLFYTFYYIDTFILILNNDCDHCGNTLSSAGDGLLCGSTIRCERLKGRARGSVNALSVNCQS